MSLWSKCRKFLQSVPARVAGSHVNLGSEVITRLSSQATFPECPELAAKIAAARGILPRNSVKPVRKS